MIIDSLANLSKYTRSVPHLDTVLAVLKKGLLDDAVVGSYSTDDGAVRYVVSAYDTHEKGVHGYEVHHREADVQLLLFGHEVMDVASSPSLSKRSEYDSSCDAQFFDGKLLTTYHADTSTFVIFFPGEAHEPCISDGQVSSIRKVVFKISLGK